MSAAFPTSIKNFGAARVDGDYIPASDMNTVREEIVAIETAIFNYGVSFFAHKNGTNQTGVSGTPGVSTKITFPTEAFDNGGYYDAVNSRFTPPEGYYLIGIGIYYDAMVDQVSYGTGILLNGTFVTYVSLNKSSGTGGHGTNGTYLIHLNGSQYIEAAALQDSGAPQTISGVVALSYWWGVKVG
jgi:hypothetical protein